MIQGGAHINKDIPPFVKAGRDPIAFTGINSIGLRRRNFNNDQIRDIQEIYRYLYLSRLNVSDAVDRIEAELPATPRPYHRIHPQLQARHCPRLRISRRPIRQDL